MLCHGATMTSSRDAVRRHLLALQTALTRRGITTRLDRTGLAVLAPDGEQVDTVTVWPWPPNQDALWFFDCTGEPVAAVENVAGAADATIAAMRKSGIHV